MSARQLLRALWARRGLVLLVTGIAVALAIASRLMLPPKYEATASVVVDTRGLNPVTGMPTAPTSSATSLLATQIDVISSRAVALKVVDALKLTSAQSPAAAIPGNDPARSRISWAGVLLKNLKVKPSADSNVIKIKFEYIDPVFAAQVANAFADEYLRTSLELKLEPAKRQRIWFEEQLQTLRGAVEQRRQKLSEYQQSEGLVGTDERLDVETARLDEVSRQLLESQRKAQEAQTRLSQADQAVQSGRVQELPDILDNPLLQTIKADLVRAEGKLADISERVGKNHPQYIAAAAEIRMLNSKLAAEIDNARGSIAQTAQMARQQAGRLQQSFDAQKAHLLQLRQQRDELSVRSGEVDNAQKAYDAALQRASQVRLESQVDQTSVATLDQAVPPGSSSSPGMTLSVALALIFGSLFGAALALLLEIMNRRIRASDDVTQLAPVEVLAEIPRLRAGFKAPSGRARRFATRQTPAMGHGQ